MADTSLIYTTRSSSAVIFSFKCIITQVLTRPNGATYYYYAATTLGNAMLDCPTSQYNSKGMLSSELPKLIYCISIFTLLCMPHNYIPNDNNSGMFSSELPELLLYYILMPLLSISTACNYTAFCQYALHRFLADVNVKCFAEVVEYLIVRMLSSELLTISLLSIPLIITYLVKALIGMLSSELPIILSALLLYARVLSSEPLGKGEFSCNKSMLNYIHFGCLAVSPFPMAVVMFFRLFWNNISGHLPPLMHPCTKCKGNVLGEAVL